MPTRFYLPSTGAAPVTVAYDASWEDTANALSRVKCVTTKLASAQASPTVSESGSSGANARDVLIRQFVSDALVGAQTISGSLSGQIRMMENSANANFVQTLVVRVVANDGAIKPSSVLWAGETRTTAGVDELPATLTSRQLPAPGLLTGGVATLTTVSAQDGDRIVIEIGVRALNTVTTNYVATASFGDDSATDLAVGNTETAANNPWVQLSQTLNFVPPQPVSTAARFSFPTPPLPPWGVQEFRARVTKKGTGGTPLCTLKLHETGGASPLATVVLNEPVPAEKLVSGAWDASLLSAANGSGVELVAEGTGASGGSMEVLSVSWVHQSSSDLVAPGAPTNLQATLTTV